MVAQAFTAFQRAALTNLWSDDHGSPSSWCSPRTVSGQFLTIHLVPIKLVFPDFSILTMAPRSGPNCSVLHKHACASTRAPVAQRSRCLGSRRE